MCSLNKVFRWFAPLRKVCGCKILGIETSCDDTASAVVNDKRCILGESLKSHQEFMLRVGGIMPMIAQDLHNGCVKEVVNESLTRANLDITDVDAIAVTVKPGLPLSLLVGMNYAKMLSQTFQKPCIPIHHMEAHALIARILNENINYPFLALLISGGHCIITLVLSSEKFLVLGKCLDNGPGEAFDKVSRRLKLRNLVEYRKCSGGVAIENVARLGNPLAFEFTPPLIHYRDCNFSFCGLKEAISKYIKKEEITYGTEGDQLLPNVNDLCASFQFAVSKHLCWRLQRAMLYIEKQSLLPENCKLLVVSGGVACNTFIQNAISVVCREMGYQLFVPPPKFCTDNGIMIAWNGVEKYLNNIGIYNPDQLNEIDIKPKCPLEEDITNCVAKEHIKCDWIKLDRIMGFK